MELEVKSYILKKLNSSGSLSTVFEESRFAINYREELNAAQFSAVSSIEGPHLIIAGAGSGKTRTLVYRVARLIEMGYPAPSILLLTFTRKAANEMLNRASLLLDDRCAKILGGTFHSFANSILRKYAMAAHIDPSFTILDQSDSQDVINLIRSKSGFIQDKKRFPNKATLNKIFSLSVNTGKTIENLVLDEYPHFLTDIDQILAINKFYINYKAKSNLLDYDDLLVKLRDFFMEMSLTAKILLDSINFVMVDEYQDTNKLQSELVVALTQMRQNIMVVGDDSQSIYSFRGANYKNIIEFPNLYPGTKIVKLEENFRSTQSILNFANEINKAALEGYEKNLFSTRGYGEVPLILAATNENLQSKFVVDKVLEIREEGIPLSKICVLFRSSYFSFDLEIELNKANIPFIKIGGIKFIETAHIKDIIAFLRIALNPLDIVSWYRVLLLHEGVGPKKAEKILDEITTGKISLKREPSEFCDSELFKKNSELFDLLHKIHTGIDSPADKALKVIEYYSPIFKNTYDDFNKRNKDIDTFMSIIQKYETLESLISDMAIEPPVDSIADLGEEGNEKEDILTLSTIHSAKGLEWHSVFLIHALDGFFPSSRSAQKIETMEEERRLMYVAVTRAENNLFVSYPMNVFDRESGTTLTKPSRFLNTITDQLAEGFLLDEGSI